VVPADFDGDVWWTLTTDGYTTRVPGRLYSPGPVIKGAYELSTTAMAEGSLRPLMRFGEDDPYAWGIEGIEHPEAFTTRVGEPIEVRFWAVDRGERELGAVNMSVWKHQGPAGATVAFESLVEAVAGAGGGAGGFNLPDGVTLDDIPPEVLARFGVGRRGGRPPGPGPVDVGVPVRLPTEGANANMGRFRATFDTPGAYVIRVRIDNFNAAGDSNMGNQCCWSNGYVRVRVSE
jgi:hypothetical protein